MAIGKHIYLERDEKGSCKKQFQGGISDCEQLKVMALSVMLSKAAAR